MSMRATHRQSVHAVRTTRRLAAGDGHRSPCRRGQCPDLEAPGRYALPPSVKERARAGQSQHRKPASLYEALAAAEASPGRAVRMALHAPTRPLVEHG